MTELKNYSQITGREEVPFGTVIRQTNTNLRVRSNSDVGEYSGSSQSDFSSQCGDAEDGTSEEEGDYYSANSSHSSCQADEDLAQQDNHEEENDVEWNMYDFVADVHDCDSEKAEEKEQEIAKDIQSKLSFHEISTKPSEKSSIYSNFSDNDEKVLPREIEFITSNEKIDEAGLLLGKRLWKNIEDESHDSSLLDKITAVTKRQRINSMEDQHQFSFSPTRPIQFATSKTTDNSSDSDEKAL